MNKILTLEQMKNMSIDDITQLYREGYEIEENSKILTRSQTPTIPPTSRDNRDIPMYIYSVKFICGRIDRTVPVLSGNYATAINIHNPQTIAVCLLKKVVIALREEREETPIISNSFRYKLDPDDAFEIDCPDISNILRNSEQCIRGFIKGFVIIESPKELDVVGVYTAGSSANVESIDVETINPKIIKKIPPTTSINLNTGFNQISGTIPVGNTDDDWMVTVDPTGGTTPRPANVVGNTIPGPYVWPAPLLDSQWISFDANKGSDMANIDDKDFTYRYNFMLPQCYSNAQLYMNIRADNKASVYLNNNFIGQTTDYPALSTITTSNPTFFVTGQNNVTVVVTNNELITGFDLVGKVTVN